MKPCYVLVCCLLAIGSSPIAAQTDPRMDFEAYDPPSSLVVPENPTVRAKFSFIDVHSHHWRMDEMDLDKLIAEMDAMNMGLIVNLSGGGGQRLKGIMDNIKKYGYEDRIVAFTNINFGSISDPDWTESTLQQLEYDVRIGARGLKIFKNLGFSVNDKAGKRVAVDDPRLDPIWAKCGELGIPVLIHTADPKQFWEPFDSTNERWLELKTHPRRKRSDTDPVPWEQLVEEQHNMFKKHPNTKFISAHMSWHASDLDKLGQLLDEMPNMYVEIGAVIAELGRQPRQANKFFAKYGDRVLFGKDAYNPEEYHTYFRVLESADEYFPYYKRYHAFWRMYGLDLPDEVLKNVYYRNAMRIIPGLNNGQFPK
ncbi:MAG TPA: amidohydrolase family protein [Saprospiraceae bacterium]|nr:amidohydrolase family protein [Saprospiraceae bacterium]HMP23945.1 amidohydrolase family protein [Saprospiraceae bacterium]